MLSRASRQGVTLLGSLKELCPVITVPLGGRLAHSSSPRGHGSDTHSTTVLCVRKDGEVGAGVGGIPPTVFPMPPSRRLTPPISPLAISQVVLVADGQVTMGGTVVKPNVKKTRRIGEHAVGGFAGATADAFTLFERLENKLEEHPGMAAGGSAVTVVLFLSAAAGLTVALLTRRPADARGGGAGQAVAHGQAAAETGCELDFIFFCK